MIENADSENDYMSFPLPDDSSSSKKLKATALSNKISKQLLSKKDITHLMKQNLDEGLAVPLQTTSSKGLNLLKNYGYSGAGGLGKNLQGIQNPLSIIDERIKGENKKSSGLGISLSLFIFEVISFF